MITKRAPLVREKISSPSVVPQLNDLTDDVLCFKVNTILSGCDVVFMTELYVYKLKIIAWLKITTCTNNVQSNIHVPLGAHVTNDWIHLDQLNDNLYITHVHTYVLIRSFRQLFTRIVSYSAYSAHSNVRHCLAIASACISGSWWRVWVILDLRVEKRTTVHFLLLEWSKSEYKTSIVNCSVVFPDHWPYACHTLSGRMWMWIRMSFVEFPRAAHVWRGLMIVFIMMHAKLCSLAVRPIIIISAVPPAITLLPSERFDVRNFHNQPTFMHELCMLVCGWMTPWQNSPWHWSWSYKSRMYRMISDIEELILQIFYHNVQNGPLCHLCFYCSPSRSFRRYYLQSWRNRYWGDC